MDTVFIIDDEQDLCLTLKKILEAEGYRVEWTTDPEADIFSKGCFTPPPPIKSALFS